MLFLAEHAMGADGSPGAGPTGRSIDEPLTSPMVLTILLSGSTAATSGILLLA